MGNKIVFTLQGNELLRHSAGDQSNDHDGGLDELFWCAQISRLSNLVALNLNLITTDEILRVIGDSCPLLEVVLFSLNVKA